MLSITKSRNIVIAGLIACVASGIFLRNVYLALSIGAGFLYIGLVFKKPIYHVYFLLLTSVRFLGYIDPEEFVRIPNAFKLIDVLLVISFLLYFIKHPDSVENNKNNEIVTKIFIFILFATIFQIIFTSIRFQLPFINCFKSGRNYLCFFTGLFVLKLFDTDHDRQRILRFIFIIAVIQSILVILQNIFGNYRFLGYTRIIDQEIGNASVMRVYLPSDIYVLASFSLAFWMLFFRDKVFESWILLTISFLTGFAILLSFTRSYWICLALILALPLLVVHGIQSVKHITLLLFIAVFLFTIILFSNRTILTVKNRITSISDEVGNYTGNFAYRFEENKKRMDIIKQHLIIGPGFVHADDAPKLFDFRTLKKPERASILQTNDSGILTWLLSFGILGMIWLSYVLYFLFIKTRKMVIVKHNQVGIVVGIMAFVWSLWISSITTTGFTFTKGVICFSTVMYLFAGTIKEKVEEGIVSNKLYFS
ncbi:MAG: O-antigen ligase family protein [Candidatus Jettenia sp.]|nr:MAG: O-antigen ligase family protein [Candidatus Jettenia sp.]